ncbi:DUF2029 domain-containing protein [Glutamicibacter sp. MNS18]|uniref:glycosyltransferase family 87 protein n=1 Tax=Glutamicibacter sp. MNS18 TaxID=2989817 RepID=UPI002235792C|nr:glycosyltransferase family 87 protein [Glutamicibacter sp. MNS18]MCW4466360.1 DUF2029 domain-containing protein [Glutamicibacter sp. MNS18]
MALVLHLAVLSTVDPVDFLVYRYAVIGVFDGVDLYAANLVGPMMPDGGLPYTYTPFGVLALLPTALLGPWSAFAVWSLLTLTGFVWSMWQVIPQDRRRPWLLPVLAAVASATSVVAHHLHFGQVNVFLMIMVIWDLTRSRSSVISRRLPRGVLVGMAAAIKLTPGLFMVFFLLTRQWRLFWASTVSFIACTSLAGLLFPTMSWRFFSDTLWSLGTRVSLTGDLGTSGNNSITGLFTALGGIPKPLILAALVVAAVYILGAAGKTHWRGEHTAAWLIIGVGAPLLSPVSWIHHWVYLLPALCYLVGTRRFHRMSMVGIVLPGLLLLVGPEAGQWLFSTAPSWLWPAAAILRQSLMVASVAVIFWLQRTQPCHRLRPKAREDRDPRSRSSRAHPFLPTPASGDDSVTVDGKPLPVSPRVMA